MAKLTIGPHYWDRLRLIQQSIIESLQQSYDVIVEPCRGREPWPKQPPDLWFKTKPKLKPKA